MKAAIYPTVVSIQCGARRCKESGVYEGYEDAELSGWRWEEGSGWSCPACNFKSVGQRMTKPITVQTMLI